MDIQALETAQTQLIEANQLFDKGQVQEGLALLKKIMPVFILHQAWEKYIEVLNDASLVHYYLKQIVEAKDFITKAIEIGNLYFNGLHLNIAKSYLILALIEHSYNQSLKAIHSYQKSFFIRQQLLGKFHKSCAEPLNGMGFCYGKMGLHNNALKSLFDALYINQLVFGENHDKNAINYSNIGWNYRQKGDYQKALKFLHKALTIQLHLFGQNHLKTLNTYSSIGLTYSRMGDLAQALQYYKESLSIAQYLVTQPTAYHKSYWDLANAYHNIGFCYFRQGKLEEALEYYQKALKQWQEVCKEDDPVLAKSYDKHALCFEKQGDIAKALEYYDRGLQIRLKIFGERHPDTANSYMSMGLLKPLEERLPFFEKALQIRLQLFGEKHPDIAAAYGEIAQVYFLNRQYQDALQALQKGVGSLYEDLEATAMSLYDLPSFHHCSSPNRLLDLWVAKSSCFQALYAASQSPKDLEAANEHIVRACELIDHIRLGYKAEGSKLFLSKKTRAVYTQAMNTLWNNSTTAPQTHQANYWKNLFRIAEKSRAAVLLSNMKDFDAKIAANIPADLLEKEFQLKLELSYLDQKIHQANSQDQQTEEKTIQNWQSQYFQFKREYDALTEQFEADYPAYHQLKYNTQTTDIETLQSTLSPKSAMIEYFVGEDCVYIFLVSRRQLQVVKVSDVQDLEKRVRQFVRAINAGSRGRFYKAASSLYAILIEPIEAFLEKEGIQHLIFIPDDCLFMLCFDALLKGKNEQHLIERYQISHHYSANLWYLLRQKRQETTVRQTDSFLGFAPVVFEETNDNHLIEALTLDTDSPRQIVLKSGEEHLAALKDSEIEVQKVFQLFEDKKLKAKAFFHQAASKENLLQQIEGFKYVLISTHGFVNKEVPSLSGLMLAKTKAAASLSKNSAVDALQIDNSNKLFLSETYHLPLSADLVVLSSCESGIGEVLKGEGMIALNRGFLYAGASNVLYSLIKVPQDATSELVQSFFRYLLEEQKNYAEALQLAKLQLIEKQYELRDWAGFALLGC